MILTRDGKEITAIYRPDGSEIEEAKDANGRIVYSASREITGTLPLSFSGRGKPLTDYLISGNTIQNGTLTPEAPVDVAGCGVRTGNLFDIDNVIENYYLNNGVPTPYNIGGYVLSDYIPIASNTATISARITALSDLGSHWAVYDENKSFIRGGLAFTAKHVPTVKVIDTSGAAFIRVDYALKCLTDCMLNLGSTALPYEPYGYKLPLTNNGTEYPIYLGEVESTRRIKKLVLTGEENWELNNNCLMFYRKTTEAVSYESVVCTHYISVKSFTEVFKTTNSIAIINVGIYINSGSVDVTGFKSYLATQYANGTPVTVWYVLAEPEIGVVNEPLHKIGNYADTVSYAQASVTIPTVSGANVLDMTSTIKPSEVYIKGKGIKPTGYGKLTDKNSVYILDKNGVQIAVHGQ